MNANTNVKEKKTTRFNIIDVLIILLVVVCVCSVIFRGFIRDGIGRIVSNDTRVVTLYFENVTKEECDALKENEVLYRDGEKFGTLISASYSAQEYVVLDRGTQYDAYLDPEDGTHYETVITEDPHFTISTDPDTFTVVCQVSVSGQMRSDGFYLNGKEFIGVGKMLNVSTQTATFSMTISEISLNLG